VLWTADIIVLPDMRSLGIFLPLPLKFEEISFFFSRGPMIRCCWLCQDYVVLKIIMSVFFPVGLLVMQL